MVNRVVLDTNVLVSALIGNSYPYKVIYECILDKQIPVCISEAVMVEYNAVLNRPKFVRFPDFISRAQGLVRNLEKIAEYYEPTVILQIIDDEPDNRFLELAITANANFIITGNTNDFRLSSYEGIAIVNPRYFFENYCLTRP